MAVERVHLTPDSYRGNARLSLRTPNRDSREVFLMISDFRFDIDLELHSAKTRGGISYRPKRRQERFLQFSCVYPEYRNGRLCRDRERFTHYIKGHWIFNLNHNASVPMSLDYFGFKTEGEHRIFKGYIEGLNVGARRFEKLYEYRYVMRVITRPVSKTASVRGQAPFVPTAQDVKDFPGNWYTAAEAVGLERRRNQRNKNNVPQGQGGAADRPTGGAGGPQ